MAWLFWLGLLGSIALIFRFLWKFAAKIEEQEKKEKVYLDWLEKWWSYDPYQAQYHQEKFEIEFGMKKKGWFK